MSVGSVLVGLALALVVGAYLARPFRTVALDLDRTIKTWVAEVRAERQRRRPVVAVAPTGSGGAGEQRSREAEEAINYCPHCGRRVSPDDHFCAGCGTSLRGGVE